MLEVQWKLQCFQLILRLDLMGNSDYEYMAGLRYVIDQTWALRTHYDSDMGWGIGLTLTY